LRHGLAVEVLEQRHDLEEVRALLGHPRIDTTQIYTRIRPPQLKRAIAFYDDARGADAVERRRGSKPCLRLEPDAARIRSAVRGRFAAARISARGGFHSRSLPV